MDHRPTPPAALLMTLLLVAASCGRPDAPAAKWSVSEPTAPPDLEGRFPAVCALPGGSALVSWWAGDEEEAVLRAIEADASGVSRPRELFTFRDAFLNWADVPAFLATRSGGLLFAPVRRSRARADYELHFLLLDDRLRPRGEPRRLHDHLGPGEHGFATPFVLGGAPHCAWLDGRDAGGPGGATRLLARSIDPDDGTLGPERVLDDRVCDCCAPDAAALADGAVLLAYRDRTPREVRDISVLRLEPDGSVDPVFESGDGWVMPGCPVNGPAVAARGERALLAWYTESREPRVLVATSEDGGRTWSGRAALPILHPLGRVDAGFAAGGTPFVTYLERTPQGASWTAARLGAAGEVLEILEMAPAAPGRSSGFGRLGALGDGLLFAATADTDPPRILLRRIAPE